MRNFLLLFIKWQKHQGYQEVGLGVDLVKNIIVERVDTFQKGKSPVTATVPAALDQEVVAISLTLQWSVATPYPQNLMQSRQQRSNTRQKEEESLLKRKVINPKFLGNQEKPSKKKSWKKKRSKNREKISHPNFEWQALSGLTRDKSFREWLPSIFRIVLQVRLTGQRSSCQGFKESTMLDWLLVQKESTRKS